MEADTIYIPRVEADALLSDAIERSKTQGTQIVWLFGENGQGKTYFLKRFLDETKEDCIVSYASCSSPLGNQSTTMLKPYQPLKDVLEDLLSNSANARRRRNLIKNISLTVLAIIPIVGELAYGIKEIRRDLSEFKRGERQVDFTQFVESYFETLVSISDQGPVIIVIDDFQWTDTLSMNALELFFQENETTEKPITFVFACRRDELQVSDALGMYTQLSQRKNSIEISIPPFNASEIREYFTSRFPHALIDPDLLQWLEQKSGGNPFFLQSYIQHLLVEEILGSDGHVKGNLSTYRGMPAEIRLVTNWIMKSLNDTDLNLLLTASVLGYEFTLHELTHLMQNPSIDLIRRLRKLKALYGIVEPVGYRFLNGKESTVYRFSQHAIHTALYNELSAEEKEALHRTIAQYLNEIRLTNSGDADILNSLASSLMLHAKLGKQPQIEYESILLKARNTSELLDEDSVIEQLKELSPQLGIPLEDVERMYRRALEFAPLTTHALEGKRMVAEFQEEEFYMEGSFVDVVVQTLGHMRAYRYAEASAFVQRYLDRQMHASRTVHPMVLILQALTLYSRGVSMERALTALRSASVNHSFPTYATMARLGLVLFQPEGDDHELLSILKETLAYEGRHARIIRQVMYYILQTRYAGKPEFSAMFSHVLFPEEDPRAGEVKESYPKTEMLITR